MPIETDSGNIDFVWRFSPNQDGQEAAGWPLRLHKTPEYGWTISFLGEDSQPLMSLPADFLSEVADHIGPYMNRSREVQKNLASSRTVAGLGLPQIGGKKPTPKGPSSVRPMATLPKTQTLVVPGGKKIEVLPEDAEADFAEDDGTFLPSGHDASEVEFDDNDPVFQTFTIPENNKAPLSPARTKVAEIDPAQILAERERAATNPNRKPGIKKRHTENE